MFRLFRKKENNALEFLKGKDIEVANAYRLNSVTNIKSGFNSTAIDQLKSDIVAHSISFGYNGKNDTNKYVGEELVVRTYNILSESDEEVVIKRDVTFKKVKYYEMMMRVADSFSEIFTIKKSNNNYIITNISLA